MYQEGVIDPPTKEYLTLETNPPPRTQQMYFLQKKPISVRPIVSGCGVSVSLVSVSLVSVSLVSVSLVSVFLVSVEVQRKTYPN